jgi:hypothetical protein
MNSVRETDIDKYLNGYAYLVLSTILVIFVLSVDRIYLLDNDNYIVYFSDQNVLSNFFQEVSDAKSLVHAAAQFLSEEPLWLLYTQIVSSILSPTLSVYFTVFLLNSTIIYSCSKFEYRLSGLLLWVLLPMGAAVMGLYQIRQGLAFSLLALFFARRWNLTIGALIAAMVHTTFAVPLMVFLFLSLKIFRSRPLLFVLIFVMVCYVLTSFFAISFEEFSGRRSVTYEIDDGKLFRFTSTIGAFLLALPSIIVVFDRKIQVTKSVMEISMMQIGVFIWLTFCFFVFPIGAARVGYFSATFSIFTILVSGRDLWRRHPFLMSTYALAVILEIYAGVRNNVYIDNTY